MRLQGWCSPLTLWEPVRDSSCDPRGCCPRWCIRAFCKLAISQSKSLLRNLSSAEFLLLRCMFLGAFSAVLTLSLNQLSFAAFDDSPRDFLLCESQIFNAHFERSAVSDLFFCFFLKQGFAASTLVAPACACFTRCMDEPSKRKRNGVAPGSETIKLSARSLTSIRVHWPYLCAEPRSCVCCLAEIVKQLLG